MLSTGVAWLILSAFVPVAAAAYVMVWRTKCPRCHNSLRQITIRAAALRAPQPIAANFLYICPHCGVSFDGPMEKPAGQ
jgi:uncharacterized protein with PIN domain